MRRPMFLAALSEHADAQGTQGRQCMGRACMYTLRISQQVLFHVGLLAHVLLPHVSTSWPQATEPTMRLHHVL